MGFGLKNTNKVINNGLFRRFYKACRMTGYMSKKSIWIDWDELKVEFYGFAIAHL